MNSGHDSKSLFLDGPAGQLEAILWTPADGGAPPLAAVVCHPHPLFGGTMHNKVVYQVAKSLDTLGLTVLRFNFRGTGKSAGVHDRGVGERGDVQAALNFLSGEFAGVPQLVAGFSFGSMVGLRVGCEDERVVALIGLGLPVNQSDVSFLESCVKPKLFVQGGQDQFGAVEKLQAAVSRMPEPKRMVAVADGDHFFVGKLDQVDAAISEWTSERIAAIRGPG
jgi:uncharacterized protein